jgi:hypothetical protein
VSIPLNSPGPLAFIPPVVAPIAANNIVPLAIAASAGVAGLSAVIAGAPLAAGVALGFGLVAGAELLFPRPLGGQNPQGWGTQNGPEHASTQTLPENFTGSITGQYSPTGTNVITTSGKYIGKLWNGTGINCPVRELPLSPGTSTQPGGISGFEVQLIGGASCQGTAWEVRLNAIRATDGVKLGLAFASGGGGWTGIEASVSITSTAADRLNVEESLAPAITTPWLGVPDPIQIENYLAPEPLPLPAYVPQPATVPAVPDAEPVTQPEPATPAEPPLRIAPPLPVPSSPPWVSPSWPGSIPGSVPGQFPSNPTQPTQTTEPDGTVTPTEPDPVTQTQPDTIVPWPGAPSIGGTGAAPEPTLEGIAQEVGRIEQKIDLMNTPTSPGNLIDLLGEARRLGQAIWELLTSLSAGTTYTLDSPCEVDDEGVKLPPIEIEAPGSTNAFGVLMNRTDALAELIQAHKNLKQPGCKHKLAGEIVTVNFQQIE